MKIKKFLYRFWKKDSNRKVSWIGRYLEAEATILDMGSGPGWVTKYLKDMGFDVTPVDIIDLSVANSAVPEIYDGYKLPFTDKQFDVCLILTVLHHTGDPVHLLREADRTSQRIIVIEDIHRSKFHKILVKIADSVMNLEFSGHPHNNMDDSGWRDLFKKEGLEIMDAQYHRIALMFDQAVYLLESGGSSSVV